MRPSQPVWAPLSPRPAPRRPLLEMALDSERKRIELEKQIEVEFSQVTTGALDITVNIGRKELHRPQLILSETVKRST